MNTLIGMVYNTMSKKPVVPPPREDTPTPPMVIKNKIFDCSNHVCIAWTKDLSNWKIVQYTNKYFHFCSEECWNEWLANPAYIGAWGSPITAPQSPSGQKD